LTAEVTYGRDGQEYTRKYLDHVGGFAGGGSLYDDNIGCFWDIEASRVAESDGGTGLPTAQMQTLRTYLDAGWDFVGESGNGEGDIWTIHADSAGYPRLAWE
jgi:hypothetical protein